MCVCIYICLWQSTLTKSYESYKKNYLVCVVFLVYQFLMCQFPWNRLELSIFVHKLLNQTNSNRLEKAINRNDQMKLHSLNLNQIQIKLMTWLH